MKKCFDQPNKRRYNTLKEAETDILIFDAANMRAYHCDSCNGWHLTSVPGIFKK